MRILALGACLFLVGLGCTANQSEEDLTIPGGVCEVHHIPLLIDKVRINYGKQAFNSREEADRAKHFPNAKSSVSGGGCVITETSKLTARVSYCPECRKAETNWLRENGLRYKPVGEP
ncbi:hypothetical protein BH10PLA2_BH10PLA2_04650 [soil metagenome]